MALTIPDIIKITCLKEKETIDTELKSFRALLPFDGEQQKKIAYEIIAFANRQGGKIIFGINDDGQVDEKINIDVDQIKSKLHNLCFHNISPVIECPTQFIDEPGGQFFIIYVPKRKGIPHAFVSNRTGSEINSRIYYIRTSHGKRLVSDGQLEWLFLNQDDPNYNYSFRVGFEFDKNMYLLNGIVPMGNYSILHFRDLLNQEDRNSILKDSKKFTLFIGELMPYLILETCLDFFKDSWHINITQGFDRMSSGPIVTNPPTPSSKVRVHEILLPANSFLLQHSWDFAQILKELYPHEFHLPLNTGIAITTNSIVLTNPAFKIEIRTGMLSGGAGCYPKSFNHEIYSERYPADFHEISFANFLHYDAAGYLFAEFNYPEYDMEEFHKYFKFYNSLKEIIDFNWNFDEARKKHPPKEALVMNNKLDEILELVRNPQA